MMGLVSDTKVEVLGNYLISNLPHIENLGYVQSLLVTKVLLSIYLGKNV